MMVTNGPDIILSESIWMLSWKKSEKEKEYVFLGMVTTEHLHDPTQVWLVGKKFDPNQTFATLCLIYCLQLPFPAPAAALLFLSVMSDHSSLPVLSNSLSAPVAFVLTFGLAKTHNFNINQTPPRSSQLVLLRPALIKPPE